MRTLGLERSMHLAKARAGDQLQWLGVGLLTCTMETDTIRYDIVYLLALKS